MGPQLPHQLSVTTPLYSLSLSLSHTHTHTHVSKMLGEKGKDWDHGNVIELKGKLHQYKVECKYGQHVFIAGASCFREHLLHLNLACRVVKCTADEALGFSMHEF